ncbi:methylated-DNA--[protein]-cysteine S-methyltransferase [Plastoroseomonas hellenica]|uniref:methylated-DNA--[protein]-cysteine S-methyltransferase n=1 Tax=Plastoroseomonas hellenica TaxID=2687306 RepID=UPI001BA9D88B|nr:methylated-DNA--[protein]-cysteine S-methyltransferase [Plastoroseomonas hellenica]
MNPMMNQVSLSPASVRAGGRTAAVRFATGTASLGAVLVARSDAGICAILLGDEPEALVQELRERFADAEVAGGDAATRDLLARVLRFIEAPRGDLDLPLDAGGTDFQQRVWQALRGIPAGETAGYAEIARRIGAPKAVRAVAQACGANPIAVAIPCHRVVRSDGALSGYRWGVARKRALLDNERKRALLEKEAQA